MVGEVSMLSVGPADQVVAIRSACCIHPLIIITFVMDTMYYFLVPIGC